MEVKTKYRLNNKHDDLLVDCVLKTIKTSFGHTPTILISQNIRDDQTNKDEFDEKFTKELISRNIPIIVSHVHIDTNLIYMQGYILIIKLINDCKILSSLKIEVPEDNIKYLVILFNYEKENCAEILQVVGQNISIYDVTYVITNTDKQMDIVTFLPQINETTCALQYNLPAKLLSTCSLKENFNAFPMKKPQNYMRCPLKIGMASLFPFSNIANRSSFKNYDHLHDFHGSDLEILKIMANIFNFTPEFYYIFRFEENPFINTEFVKFVLNRSLDICAGGMYRIYGDLVDYSGVYNRQAAVWIYSVRRDSRSWKNFVGKVDGLYIFMIFYFLYCFVWKLFCIFDKQATLMGRVLLNAWGALIGTSSLEEGITLKQKILNVVYSLMCIHLSAYISVQMFSFLTVLAPPVTFKSNADILESGLQPYLMPSTKYFMSDQAYISFANTAKDCKSFLDCEEITLKHNGVTAVIDSMFTALQAETAVNDEATTLMVFENLLTVFHEMLLRKDLPITKRFQEMMTRLKESGISDRLFDEAIGILTKSKSESAAKNMMSHSYSCGMGCTITLAQSAGAFYVWIFGCGLSFYIFVMEVMLRKSVMPSNADILLS